MVASINKDLIPISIDPHVNLININTDLDILMSNYDMIVNKCLSECDTFNKAQKTYISGIKLDNIRYINNEFITFLLNAHPIDNNNRDIPNHNIFVNILICRDMETYHISNIYIEK